MFRINRVGLLACGAAMALAGGGFADTGSDATNEELRARIAELESRLSAVETQESQDWLTEQRAEEIKNLVQDVLADADTRSSMMAQGMTAGYDNGFVISSADGNWLFRLNSQIQARFYYTSYDINAAGAVRTKRNLWSFEVPRVRFIMSGNVVSPEWFYYLDINAAVSPGGDPAGFPEAGIPADFRGPGVLQAYAGYDFGNGLSVKAGTFKDSFLREENIDSRYSLAVERSNVNYFFTTGYTDGIMVSWEGDMFRFDASYNDGEREGQTVYGFGATPPPTDADLSFTGRGEWLAMGTWDQFSDLTSAPGEEMGVLVGGGLHWEESGSGVAGTYNNLVGMTFDAQVEFGGASLFGAFIFQNVNNNVGTPSNQQYGIVVNGGYYLTDMWELFGQFEYLESGLATIPSAYIFTVGANGYFARHNAKWTTDIGVAVDGFLDGTAGADGGVANLTGYTLDGAAASTQVVVRTQLQIAF